MSTLSIFGVIATMIFCGVITGAYAQISGTDSLEVSVQSDKLEYAFAETATISGMVSERVSQTKPTFSQAQVDVLITGPANFQKKISLYPDAGLNFKTTLKLDKVLGITGGTYTVTATYAGVRDVTMFSVSERPAVETVAPVVSGLGLSTENSSYIPGQRVVFSASTDNPIPLEGLKVEVYDAGGKQIYSGTMYPNQRGEFTGYVFLTTVNPVYGQYDIVARYGQLEAQTTFTVLEDVRDLSQIVIATDKQIYAQGEPIVISGRSNKYVPTLNVEVLQTGSSSIGKTVTSIFKINDQVSLAGDSTFRYELRVPAVQSNLGDFRVTVSRDFGSATTSFKIVDDPSQYVATERKNVVMTNKESYSMGEKVMVSGSIVPRQSSTFVTLPVSVTVEDSSGRPLSIVAKDRNVQVRSGASIAEYRFTAIPDPVGNYGLEFTVDRGVFAPGKYNIRASYDSAVFSTTFSVGETTAATANIVAKTDKQVYGLGETVKVDGTLFTVQPNVKLVLVKPDGKTVIGSAPMNDSKFSWSWDIPKTERAVPDIRETRSLIPSVFGNYKISIFDSSRTSELFFKVSQNPETDTLGVEPLQIKAEKAVYGAGDRLVITGSAVLDQATSTMSSRIPDRVSIQVRTMAGQVIYDATPGFDAGGYFRTTFDLPLGVFKDGTYKVTAVYQKARAETTFEVRNNIPLGSTGEISLLLQTDKDEYSPGEKMQITATSSRVTPLTRINLMILEEKNANMRCDGLQCGIMGQRVDISRTYDNGIYRYDFTLPANVPLGTYVLRADAGIGIFTTSFRVIDKPPVQEPVLPQMMTISEKFNRLPDSEFDIALLTKTLDGNVVAPLLLQGSVITTRGSEMGVNVMVLSGDGQCIIGQESECAVTQSTQDEVPNYVTVNVAGLDYNVEYSGPEESVEKFAISATDGAEIPDSIWTVQIVKEGDLPSRFYYSIVHKQIQ